MRSRTTYACFAALAACVSLLCSAAFGGRAPGTKLSSADMARLRGGFADLGKCSITCAFYQAFVGNPGTWSCVGQANGAACRLCQQNGNGYTMPGQSTVLAGMCPGNFFTQGAVQDCGFQSQAGSAACQNQTCVGQKLWGPVLCSDPKQAVSETP